MTENMLEIAIHWEDHFVLTSQHIRKTELFGQRRLSNYFNFLTKKKTKARSSYCV